jgi:hypothetical protein
MTRYLISFDDGAMTFPEEEMPDQSAEFTLLVPATPLRHLLFRHGTEQEAAAIARELGEKARKAFEKNPVNIVDARVGSESPEDAIDNEVKAHPDYVGFVISTSRRRNRGGSDWTCPSWSSRSMGCPSTTSRRRPISLPTGRHKPNRQ